VASLVRYWEMYGYSNKHTTTPTTTNPNT
jgi:hypothetical protein